MVQIQALHGIRYDLSRVGSLSDVVAPPYDVIDPKLQNDLYNRNPHNVVRLILNRAESNDDAGAVYQRAARLWQEWNRSGILVREKTPAIYVYHQEFKHAGRVIQRRGFMARVRLEKFDSGTIFPHEETHSRVREDRLKLTQACRANLSQIFGLYPDPNNQIQTILENNLDVGPPQAATDVGATVHKMWPVSDERVITQIAGLMASKPIFVADGHHRYESACAYRDSLAANEPLDSEHPANFVLMMCVSMSDPGLIVLPTHRLFRGVPPTTVVELGKKLQPALDLQVTDFGREQSEMVWEEMLDADPSTLGLYSAKDNRWCLAKITDAGRAILLETAGKHSDAWRNLGVAILHELVLGRLLKQVNLPSPRYVHSVPEVVDALLQGDSPGRDATGQMGTASRFELAALVRPASVDDIQRISIHGERMPAKSTYFYPKLLSGLVFNSLE